MTPPLDFYSFIMMLNNARLATLSDLPQLLEIELKSFTGDRLSRRSFRYFLSRSQGQIWCVGEPLQGYALVLFRKGSKQARLYSLAVLDSARGKGFGRLLLAAVEQAASDHGCDRLQLEVDTRNHVAMALYTSAGYAGKRVISGYYEDGGDALRLVKTVVL